MSNLIPTPIVDKNGVASVRHKKVAASYSSASEIPAPFYQVEKVTDGEARKKKLTMEEELSKRGNAFTRWRNKKHRDKLTDELANALYPENDESYRNARMDELKMTLEQTMSTDEIGLAIEITRVLTRDGLAKVDVKRDLSDMIWTLRKSVKKGIAIRALHAHSDWLKKRPGEAHLLMKTIDNVIDLDLMTNGGNDGIEHFAEYMAATLHPSFDNFDIIYIWRKEYMNAVVQHPDKIDQIVDYMKERSGFDEDGFKQYLNASTPLADGSL